MDIKCSLWFALQQHAVWDGTDWLPAKFLLVLASIFILGSEMQQVKFYCLMAVGVFGNSPLVGGYDMFLYVSLLLTNWWKTTSNSSSTVACLYIATDAHFNKMLLSSECLCYISMIPRPQIFWFFTCHGTYLPNHVDSQKVQESTF
jgi:hypothetical protein